MNKVKFKKFKLNEKVWFQEGPGVRNTQFTTNGVKLLNIRNIQNNNLYLEKTKTHISKEEAYVKYKHFLLDDGDLIFASSGIKIEYFDKKITFIKKENLPLCLNTSIIRFKVLNKNELLINYLKYYFMSNYFKKQVKKKLVGAAQLNFGPTHLNKMTILIPINSDQSPNLAYQEKVVKELEKIENAIELKKKAIELNKEYLESLFYDSIKNIKLEKLNLDIETDLVSSGSTPKGGREVYLDKGKIIFIRSQNVLMNKFSNHNKLFISEEIHNKMKRTWVKNKDILLNITGASIGRCTIYNGKDNMANVNQHVCIIRLKKESNFNTIYLNYYLASNNFQNYIQKINSGGTREALNFTQIKKFNFLTPPITLQNKFAKEVEKFELIRERQEKSLNELDDLFNSTMQRAFKGEL